MEGWVFLTLFLECVVSGTMCVNVCLNPSLDSAGVAINIIHTELLVNLFKN